MGHFLSFENRKHRGRSFAAFIVFVAIHPILLFAIFKYAFGNVWAREISAGKFALILNFLLWQFVFCCGEFLFHRYMLHTVTINFLKKLAYKHGRHHMLTPVGSVSGEHNAVRIRSAYPIVHKNQDESSTFPRWALAAFYGTFTPLFALLAWRFPDTPTLLTGYPALTILYACYELLHVLHHEPYERWEKRIAHPLFGNAWRLMYGFHQAHHANPDCNMAIGGFFGLPLADWMFRTYKQPNVLLNNRMLVSKETILELSPKPRWPISVFDAAALKRESRILQTQK